MTWTWRYEDPDGQVVEPDDAPRAQVFPSQGDAESWLGETWPELLHAGVAAVTLLDGDRVVYGPMGLAPAE